MDDERFYYLIQEAIKRAFRHSGQLRDAVDRPRSACENAVYLAGLLEQIEQEIRWRRSMKCQGYVTGSV